MESPTISARRTRFFVGITVAVIVLVFVGFAPTYYLAAFFDYQILSTTGMAPRGLTFLEHVHGLTSTVWLLIFLAQTMLVRRENIQMHQKLGKAGIVVAVLVAIQIAVLMVVTASARNASGITETDFITYTNRNFWGNVVMLVPFSLFIGFGFAKRRKPEVHKRLMVLSMLCLLSTTIGRISVFGLLVGLPRPVVMLPLFIGMLSAIMIYDYRTHGRLHPLSAIGPPTIFVLALLGAFILPQLEPLRWLVALL